LLSTTNYIALEVCRKRFDIYRVFLQNYLLAFIKSMPDSYLDPKLMPKPNPDRKLMPKLASDPEKTINDPEY
jgi:hypothetical protein